ncbi:HU family DNA-binding protein [Gammaproteobacteria bacterium]|jgi:integration host factor subunit alpha|nr:HU family DNA-binding protein [Gammaproteobacteria bacterium]
MTEQTLSKAVMAKVISEEFDLTQIAALDMIESFFANIFEYLVSGKEVRISGFGNFVLIDKEERPGRNPKNKKSYVISRRRVVSFRAGKLFTNDVVDKNS